MANAIYNHLKSELQKASFNFTSDTIKVALVTSSYAANIDSHDNFDDITNEVSGTGYTAGGATLTSPTVTQDNTNDRGVFDAADVTWASSTITARGAVIYKSTGTASTSKILGYVDFGADKSSSGSDFTIQWHTNGILYLS